MSDAAFIGVGELPSGRHPERSFMGSCVASAHLALADASLTPTDVDTIVLIPCLHSFIDQADLIFSRVVEELGLAGHAKASFMVHSGGSTSDNAVRVASGLIGTGQAETVLIVCAERWGSANVADMVDMLSFNGIPVEWEVPTGLTFNAIGALITARYMAESGSTPEEMAEICVSLRKWAQLNPRAMYRDKPLTAEAVLASRMVSTPLHALECPMLADGAVSLVMTSAERAAAIPAPWVRIAGEGGCVSHYSIGQEFDLARMGWPRAAAAAYDAAGWGPEDAQVAEVYDSYAAVMAIGIEGLGLCKPGEGARTIASGATLPGGSLPLNTNGGLLSAGHTGVGGGTALLAEAVRQLRGRAEPPRQVEGARRAIVGGTGGSYMDSQVMLLERVEAGGAR
ncbi:MAG: thiolase family protein [Acidimicrobiia bacterium]